MLSRITRTNNGSYKALPKYDQDKLNSARIWRKQNKPANVLHYLAAERGNSKLIQFEASTSDVQVDEKNILGFTPLHIAVLNNQFDAFNTLLGLGADPNTTSHSGNSVLATAVTQWLLGVDSDDGRKFCWRLLEKGAKTEFLDQDGNTVLHIAMTIKTSEERRKSVLRVLLAFGGRLSFQSASGTSAFAKAIYTFVDAEAGGCALGITGAQRQPECVTEETVSWLLSRPIDLAEEPKRGGDLVAELLAVNAWPLAGMLLEQGARGDGQSRDGTQSIHIAALHGQIDLMERLLKAACDEDELSMNSNLVLSMASSAIHAGIVDAQVMLDILLPRFNVNSFLGGAGKGTILWDAASNYMTDFRHVARKADLLKLLLSKYGADPTMCGTLDTVLEVFVRSVAQNKSKFYRLSEGKKHEYVVDVVKLLFQKGVNFRQQNGGGHYLLLDAVRTGYIPLINLLKRQGAPSVWDEPESTSHVKRQWTLIHLSSKLSQHELLQHLLFEEQKIHDVAFTSPLIDAAAVGNKQGAEILIDFGINFEIRSADGYTALHYAAEGGFDLVIQLLLRRGANVNSITNHLATPLHMYLSQPKRDIRIVKMLVEHGSHVNALADDYRSPLDCWMDANRNNASAYSDWEISTYLRGKGAHPMKFMFPSTNAPVVTTTDKPKSIEGPRDSPLEDDAPIKLSLEKFKGLPRFYSDTNVYLLS